MTYADKPRWIVRVALALLGPVGLLRVLRAWCWLMRVPRVVIPRRDGTGPYLTRWFLSRSAAREYTRTGRTGGPGFYLHLLHCSDDDPRLHNHPWEWAWSVILDGAYFEERGDFVRYVRVWGDFVPLRADTFHRVELPVGPTWTLFRAGPRTGEWGFRPKQGAAGRDTIPDEDEITQVSVATWRLETAELAREAFEAGKPLHGVIGYDESLCDLPRCKCGKTRSLVYRFGAYRCPACT